MLRMLDQCSTVEVLTNAAVSGVSRGGGRRFTVRCADGRSFAVDDVVFAASGPGTLQLLDGVPGSKAQQSALRGIEFHYARLTLHTDPIYAPANAMYWSFLNCQLHGASFCEASMWLADVVQRRAAGDRGEALEELDDASAASAGAGAASGRLHAHAAHAGNDSGAD